MGERDAIFVTSCVFIFFMGCAYLNYLGDFHQSPTNQTAPVCNVTMFQGDENAFKACQTLYALQYNWYPSPIAGLFSYQAWNGFDGFWQNGVVLESIANYVEYSESEMYISVLLSSRRSLDSLLMAYAPEPSYDDMAWYALAYLRISEVLRSKKRLDDSKAFLKASKDIHDWIWENGWDKDSCGGFWFDFSQKSKQSIENLQMLQLSAKLYETTKDKDILPKIVILWKFINSSGIINRTTFLISDGVDDNCTATETFGYSYNMGIAIGGLLVTGDILNKTDEFYELSTSITRAAITKLTRNGIFQENCEPKCNDDQRIFKGIFFKNIRYLINYIDRRNISADPEQQQFRDYIVEFLNYNINTVWKYNRCMPSGQQHCNISYKDGPSSHLITMAPVFGEFYSGPFSYASPIVQTTVLDLLNAGIAQGTKCVGSKNCSYDPPIPPPRPLNCDNNPCPKDQPCCAFQQYCTCCMTSQKCVNNECV